MNTVPLVGVLLLFALVVVGSVWYIVFRLGTAFGLRRRWLLRVLVLAALVGSFMLMVPATTSADLIAGLLYVFGGYLFAGYVFLTLAFVLLHVIERAWHIPKARVGAATLLLAAGAALVGGMKANTFAVVETEIALPGLDRDGFDYCGPHTRWAVLHGHARRHSGVSLHSWPVSPRRSAGVRVARGRDVHVSRSTRHLKRVEPLRLRPKRSLS